MEYEFKLLKSVVEVNQHQRNGVIEKLLNALGDLKGKSIGIWGLAFKPETDDVREAPAIEIITKLIELGAKIYAYDPIALDNFHQVLNDPAIVWSETALEAVQGKEALCLLTEWKEFAEIDLKTIESALARPILIDCRNVYLTEQIKQTGLSYYPVGRQLGVQRNI